MIGFITIFLVMWTVLGFMIFMKSNAPFNSTKKKIIVGILVGPGWIPVLMLNYLIDFLDWIGK